MQLVFLGTGAAGGTPGHGRSARRESSLLIEAGSTLLLDVTTDLDEQLASVGRLGAVLLTHAHRDAAGGVPALGRWWQGRGLAPIPLYASCEAIAVLRGRYRRLDHVNPVSVEPGRLVRHGGLTLSAVEVPHALDRRFRTFAWRVADGRCAVVYASDVARLEQALERFARDAQLLVIDGAMWQRTLFSHLTIDRELPTLCGWAVDRILVTQIGRSAPAHEQLERAVGELCAKAAPAWDGMIVELGP